MTTEPIVTQLEDDCYRVCLTQDAIEACTTCSSAHLIEDKVAQLRRSIASTAAQAYTI